MKPSSFLTARSTVISLFSAICGALLFASSVPQRVTLGGKTPPWVERLPDSLRGPATLLGLDNVVGSGWFALLVAVFWLSLVISTVSQYSSTRGMLLRLPAPEPPAGCVRLGLGAAEFSALARAYGYRLAGSAGRVHRHIRNRAGYWGNFLLHVGLVTAVFFSLVYVLTQHRVLVRLSGQEITRLSAGNVLELRGALAQRQGLPFSVVLMELRPRFWENDRLAQLSSELYFTGQPGGEPVRVDVAVSDKSRFGPYVVYQANSFGRSFDLECLSERGELRRVRLDLPYPQRRDQAGYGETVLAGTGYLLKGKFYADAERRSIELRNPRLTLRLYDGKALAGEVSLAAGEAARLGPFTVRLARSAWWTDVLLDGTRGTAGIFSGFALILAGVLAAYCLVPREIIVRETDDAILIQHVARRFAPFYREEFVEIIAKAGGKAEG